jgi:translation initiation factor IF-3
MDFGKYKYEIAQKAREARQNQTHIVVKEMRMRPNIESHDYETKRNHIEKFLKGGDKVKVTIQFRGREQSRPELGYKLLQRLAKDVVEIAFVEFAPKQEGRSMTMVLGPVKRKSDALAEAKKAKKAAEKAASSQQL